MVVALVRLMMGATMDDGTRCGDGCELHVLETM